MESTLALYIDKSLARYLRDPKNAGLCQLLLDTTRPFASSQAQGFQEEKQHTSAALRDLPKETLLGASQQKLGIIFDLPLEVELKEAVLCGATLYGTVNPLVIDKADRLEAFGLSVAHPERLLHIFTPSNEID